MTPLALLREAHPLVAIAETLAELHYAGQPTPPHDELLALVETYHARDREAVGAAHPEFMTLANRIADALERETDR